MATVCALNNYALDNMWKLARLGKVPRQHVWGLDGLAGRGHAIDIAPFHEAGERNLLERLSGRARGLLGHLDQEAHALRRIRRLDVLYSADQGGLAALALARAILPAARFVAVVHHPVRNPLRLAAAARHDVLLCLSDALADELRRDLGRRGRRRPRIISAPWGPDLSSPIYRARGEANGVVSAGKSNRDLVTISEALRRTGAPGVIYDLERQLDTAPNGSVRIVHPGAGPGIDPNSPGGYVAEHTIGETAAASVVAIPVADPNRLTGLTEAVDALALGKPIVVTRSAYFPFDVEAIGCGIWVDPGDVEAWSRALAQLTADSGARAEMGAAGRRFAEREFNYDRFCSVLAEAVDDAE